MKVLQIFKDYFPPVNGGIERHINLLSNGLRQRGIEVEVLVSNSGNRLMKEIINDISVTRVPQLGRFASAPLNPTFSFWLTRLAKEADILHFHLPNPTAVLAYMISGLKMPVVVTYHSDIVKQAQLFKLYRPFLLTFLSKAQTIISTSPNYPRSSKILSGFLSKCIVIPLSVNPSIFTPWDGTAQEIVGLKQRYGKPLMIFIGKFRYYKGLHILIEAMKKIPGRLLLVGGGPLERKLRSQVSKSNLSGKIVFLGELEDRQMINYLQACDLLLLPSHLRSEAFGVVQLEAMACEKPVISTELGTGTSYVNQDNITGLVVPPNDVDALAKAANYLITKPKIREKFGKTGRQMVKKYYTDHLMLEKIIELYHQTLAMT